MSIQFRPGQKSDCEVLAQMMNIASGGIFEYLFGTIKPGLTAVEVVAENMVNDHSYRSDIVAVSNDNIVGMARSFPSAYHRISPDARVYFPDDRLNYLAEFFETRVENSWYLNTLCVLPDHRRQGIGEKLIELAKSKAVEKGFDTISLMVFQDNRSALSLYRRTGFQVVQTIDLIPNEHIRHEGGCLLMKAAVF